MVQMIAEIIEILHSIVESDSVRYSGTFVMREMSDDSPVPVLTKDEKFFTPEQI